VQKLGGIDATFELIKQGAFALWDWISPIVYQLGDTFAAAFQLAWTACQTAFNFIVDIVTTVWNSISGTTGVIFTSIKDNIMEALYMAEFGFKNFGRVMELVWVNAKLAVVRFTNEVIYFFKDVIPTVVVWAMNNWQEIFFTTLSYLTNAVKNFVSTIKNAFTAIWDYIRGEDVNWDKIWVPLKEGAVNTIKEMPNIPERVAGDVEKALAEESKTLTDSLANSYAAFRKDKLGGAIKGAETEAKKAEVAGANVGKSFANAATKEAKKAEFKVEGAVIGSAEDIMRMREYMHGNAAPDKTAKQQAAQTMAEGDAIFGKYNQWVANRNRPTTGKADNLGMVDLPSNTPEIVTPGGVEEGVAAQKSMNEKLAELVELARTHWKGDVITIEPTGLS
jgi:hypothetical protein